MKPLSILQKDLWPQNYDQEAALNARRTTSPNFLSDFFSSSTPADVTRARRRYDSACTGSRVSERRSQSWYVQTQLYIRGVAGDTRVFSMRIESFSSVRYDNLFKKFSSFEGEVRVFDVIVLYALISGATLAGLVFWSQHFSSRLKLREVHNWLWLCRGEIFSGVALKTTWFSLLVQIDMDSSALVPIFGGQGMMSLKDSEKILSLATSPSGAVLLDACYTAFHDELLSLTPEELRNIDICASDFKNMDSILFPDSQKYHDNPTLSGATLILLQNLAYLVYAESPCVKGAQLSFEHALRSHTSGRVGVLGFSSGIISACVVATSPSVPSFISNALQAYRLALWIGIRSQIHRKHLLDSSIPERLGEACPWSLMLRGLNKHQAQQFISCFNQVCLIPNLLVSNNLTQKI